MSSFPGLAHVAITVTDLEKSVEWYSRLFDSRPVLDEDEESGTFHHSVFALANGMLFGLHSHHGSTAEGPFDERRAGLDHIAFACSQEELVQWRDRLDELMIEHSGIKHAGYGSGISFRDVDNIALEFFAPPA